MTLWTPHYLQTKTYSAQRLRMVHAGVLGVNGEGIVDAGDLAVSQKASGANMSVDIAAGAAFVRGDDSSRQGNYHLVNDGVVNLAVAASHATLPRIDTVIARVYDTTVIGGGVDAATVEVLTGTATSGATLPNRNGAPTLPATAIRLADFLVPATSTTVTNANIGNPKYPLVGLAGFIAGSLSSVAGAPPQYARGRPGYVPRGAFRGSVATLTNTGVYWGLDATSEEYDTDLMHDNATNPSRWTAKTPGFYELSAVMQPGVNGTLGAFRVNADNALLYGNRSISSAAGLTSLSAGVHLGYGDYVEPVGQQNSGGNQNFTLLEFAIRWTGP